jgi:hypothetical protein
MPVGDRFVAGRTGTNPLRVSGSLRAICAMRCARVLQLVEGGAPIDRTGGLLAVEVYPAGRCASVGCRPADSRSRSQTGAWTSVTTGRGHLAVRDRCHPRHREIPPMVQKRPQAAELEQPADRSLNVQGFLASGAAQESNLPSLGLPDLTGLNINHAGLGYRSPVSDWVGTPAEIASSWSFASGSQHVSVDRINSGWSTRGAVSRPPAGWWHSACAKGECVAPTW